MQATARLEAETELARLNALITPDKPDDELIHLIEERKTWEAKLALLSGTPVPESVEATPPLAPEPVPEVTVTAPVEESVIPPSPEPVLPVTIDEDFLHRTPFELTNKTFDLERRERSKVVKIGLHVLNVVQSVLHTN